jgi:hypothetical protein
MKVLSWNSTHYTHLYQIWSSMVHKTLYKNCCEHNVKWDYWEGDVYPNCPMGDGVATKVNVRIEVIVCKLLEIVPTI